MMPRPYIEFSGRRMNEILKTIEPRFRRAFLTMIERVRGELPPDAIREILRTHNFSLAEDTFLRASELYARESTKLFVLGGEQMAAFVAAALDVTVGFNQFSERAVLAIRESELSTIREFTREQREVVRDVVTEGIARGINPIQQAREFRDSIGLTMRQQ